MRVYLAVEWHEGFFYGTAYTVDETTGEQRRLYTSYAYSDKRDAQEDVLSWRIKWVAQGRVQ